MRSFTEKEKALLSFIVNEFNANRLGNLQVAKILRENVNSFLAISWEIEPTYQVKLYLRKTEQKLTHERSCEKLISVADLIYFLKELESSQCIKFISMSSLTPKNNDRMIFDRNALEYDAENDSFSTVGTETIKIDSESIYSCKGYFLTNTSTFYLDIAKDLDAISYMMIYPLPYLRDYVKNDFSTSEEQYQRKTIKYSLVAVVIALISTIVSIILR